MFVRILFHALSVSYSGYIASIVLKPVASDFRILHWKMCKLKNSMSIKYVP